MQVRIKRFDKDLPLPSGEEFEHGTDQPQDRVWPLPLIFSVVRT
jgi:hypothetical protein